MVGEAMEINVGNIEKECSTLKKNIDSFYDNVLAVYNELNWVKDIGMIIMLDFFLQM